MAYGQDGPYRAFPAGADFSTPAGSSLGPAQWRGVTLDTNGNLQLVASQGVRVLGILQDDPQSGRTGTVKVRDVSKALAGGTFAIGALLMCAADGRLITATATNMVVAQALQAGAAGRIVAVEVHAPGYVL